MTIQFRAIEVYTPFYGEPKYYIINLHGEKFSISKERYLELEKLLEDFHKVKVEKTE